MQQTSEVLAILEQMESLAGLPAAALEQLAAHGKLARLAARTRIDRQQIGDDHLFLVDGHVVKTSSGLERRLDSCLGLSAPVELFDDAGDEQERIITETVCLVLQLPDAALVATPNPEAVEVSSIELDGAESEFLAGLYERIATNQLELPARPEVALKIQQLTSDPDAGIDELTDLVQSDATLAGALLHATNSPRFRASKEILSVRDAVVRLGFTTTRMLATNLALRHIFKAKHRATREAMASIWTDSVLCSAFSYLLSENLRVLNPDRALLAGLLAGIGAIPIIQFVEKNRDDPSRAEIDQLVGKLRGITGVLVINYWGLGSDLVAVAEHSNDWGYRGTEPDYASMSIVARWAALRHLQQPYPDAAQVPAFALLGLETPGPDEGVRELEGSDEALQRLQSLFDY